MELVIEDRLVQAHLVLFLTEDTVDDNGEGVL